MNNNNTKSFASTLQYSPSFSSQKKSSNDALPSFPKEDTGVKSSLDKTQKDVIDFDNRLAKLENTIKNLISSSEQTILSKREEDKNIHVSINEKLKSFEDRLIKIEDENAKRFSNMEEQLRNILALVSAINTKLENNDTVFNKPTENPIIEKINTEPKEAKTDSITNGKNPNRVHFQAEKSENSTQNQEKKSEEIDSKTNQKSPQVYEDLKYRSNNTRDSNLKYDPRENKADALQPKYKAIELNKPLTPSNPNITEPIVETPKLYSRTESMKQIQEKPYLGSGGNSVYPVHTREENENMQSNTEIKKQTSEISSKYSYRSPEESDFRRQYERSKYSSLDKGEETRQIGTPIQRNEIESVYKRDNYTKQYNDRDDAMNKNYRINDRILEEKKRRIDQEIEKRIQEDVERRKRSTEHFSYTKKIAEKYDQKFL